MRFLLINPYCPITEGPTPPLGISFLAAVLEQAGIEVKVLDFTVFPYSKDVMESVIEAFQPTFVGVTSVTMTFDYAIEIINDVKEIDPLILTVMGGPHVSFCFNDTLNQYPALDFIVVGEGEQTIVELAAEYQGKKQWGKIKGLVFRDRSSIVVNESRELLDVNTLPMPARHLLPLGRYRALHTPISMTTSRGCPFQCIFCVGRKMVGSKVRYRDPMTVVDELEYLSKLDFPQINISDDLFTAKKSHCMAICNEILERKLSITWSAFARVDTVSLELLKKMKEAGCRTVSFGVETANEEILKTIKKKITLEKVKRAISMCAEAKIEPHVSFILGLPGESPDTLKETQEFGKVIDGLGACYGFHLLAPFPGTAVRDNNSDYDLNILTEDWKQYHANRAIVETSGVTKEMLDAIAEEWDYETHKKLGEIKDRMDKGVASDEEAWQVVNLERFLFIYKMMTDDVLENNKTSINGTKLDSSTSALKGLAEKIHEPMGKTEEETLTILKYAYDRGSIEYTGKNSEIEWKWQDLSLIRI
jgi:radical SAM superfamily enzyme YgiQ (UPF0313 family)